MNFLKNISTGQLSDAELVNAYKKTGESVYISTLYQRYMDLVFGVSLKYLKDTEKSKDAVMEIYQQLLHKLQLHEVNNFRGWLHVLARNYCLMQLRNPRNRDTVALDGNFMQSAEPAHLENGAFEKEENLVQLEGCIEALPAVQKETIKMFFLQQKCYKEIAEATGHDWNKVRSYIQNGKRNLKLCMEQKMYTMPD
ncbi:MAG TPA: sigma-70 family RNA polymerase sigma factor [Ferruginibacter sp.]|nr:sigma-70 family RNA polymerase sigma factor [Ferruginibacter sp.]HMP20484.1 sigma-70 family RNA polymerase sigma factor [Ferruginibacter sp.]